MGPDSPDPQPTEEPVSKFIDDKAAEALAARDAGNTEAIGHALAEAILENNAPIEETLKAMTDAVNRQSR